MSTLDEDFESGTAGNGITSASIFGTSFGGEPQYTATGPKSGSLCAATNGVLSYARAESATNFDTTSPYDTYCRFYVNLNGSYPDTDCEFVRLLAGGTSRCRLRIRTGGELEIRDGNTNVGVSTGTIPSSGWVRIEFDSLQSSTTLEARAYYGSNLEGTTEDFKITYTGYSGTQNINRFQLGVATTLSSDLGWRWDDAGISDSALGPTGGGTHSADGTGTYTFTGTAGANRVTAIGGTHVTTSTRTATISSTRLLGGTRATTFTATADATVSAAAVEIDGTDTYTFAGSAETARTTLVDGSLSVTSTGTADATVVPAAAGDTMLLALLASIGAP